jgi:peptidyl-prolyl cis-trans isomerase A (cyclophilin A)
MAFCKHTAWLVILGAAGVIGGCGDDDSGGGTGGSGAAGTTTTTTTATTTTTGTAGAGGNGGTGGGDTCALDVQSPDEILGGGADPAGGVFTIDEALAELPEGPGPLRAVIETELGVLTCTLRPDKAPNGVANFVGLARGRRPWKIPGQDQWVKRRYYDGLIFHRVIDDFVAQGGDPLGTGIGGPGYQFDDEISDLTHQPGTLAYANAGANTNGSQFYITEGAEPGLDGGYVVFGYCQPLEVIEMITAVPVVNEKPVDDIHTQTVTITRCAP